jgi:hypothetical protein
VGATGNASRRSGWRDGAGERRMAAVRSRGAPASNRACGKAGNGGERAGDDAHLHAELRQRAGVMER